MTAKAQNRPKETKFNHFVARFTSRPWLVGTNQFYRLWVDKSGVQAEFAGPRNWGGEENLYSQDVEDAFEKIETRLAHLQRRLENAPRPTDDERYAWAMWLLTSYLRTPAAFLCSAQVSESMRGFSSDLFRAGYGMLASCLTNPHCIELIANRDWQILTCEKPYFLKPDTGLVLTDRLDKEDCLILYPFTPFSCFLATGNRRCFSRVSVQKKRAFGLNNHLLRWSETSVACTTRFWDDEQFMLRNAVQEKLAMGEYSLPTSGRFFAVEGLKCDGNFQALCGKSENLAYLGDNTPLPDGVIEFVKKVCSHSDGGIVSEIQRQVGKMDIKASGLAADVLRLCGLNSRVRLYRRLESE